MFSGKGRFNQVRWYDIPDVFVHTIGFSARLGYDATIIYPDVVKLGRNINVGHVPDSFKNDGLIAFRIAKPADRVCYKSPQRPPYLL